MISTAVLGHGLLRKTVINMENNSQQSEYSGIETEQAAFCVF